MAVEMSATATVEKVDKTKRQLMLKDKQGKRFAVDVPEDVTGFEAIKKGDRITIDYYSSVALALDRGKDGMAPSAEETSMVQRTPAKLPGGVAAREMSATAEVVKVDTTANTLTVKGPEGVDTIHVTDPELQADLAKLKKGDKIRATYAEAVAIRVTAPKKQKKG
jgi:hypothetical protein